MAKEFEIWSEGYRATGEHGTATFHGKFPGNTFDEAVENFKKAYEGTVDTREVYEEINSDGIMPKKLQHSIWACRLFDNEADARKSFG
jgi:antirestriction protein